MTENRKSAIQIAREAAIAEDAPRREAEAKRKADAEKRAATARASLQRRAMIVLEASPILQWFPGTEWRFVELASGVVDTWVFDTGKRPTGQGSDDWIQLAVQSDCVMFVTYPDDDAPRKNKPRWHGPVVTSAADVWRAREDEKRRTAWPSGHGWWDN